MGAGKPNDQSIIATLTRAIELSDEALAHVARIAIEGIRSGVEVGGHVEAAERDMRNALRQLVLAERELRAGRGFAERLEVGPEGITEVVPAPRPDGARRGS
jgi:hypothetical protein